MLKKIRIEENGDTEFLPGTLVDVLEFEEVNEKQGFRVYDGWGVDGMYIRSGYDHLKATTGTSSSGTQYTEVRAPEGVSTEARDVKGWCHVDFGAGVSYLRGHLTLHYQSYKHPSQEDRLRKSSGKGKSSP